MNQQRGFTLVELMVSVSILVIISGTIYTAFNSSLNVYRRESGRVVMHQKIRVALDMIARDLSNMFYLEGDDDLLFQAEDVSEEDGEQDTITFVTVLDPSPDPFLAQLYPEEEDQTTEDETIQATSDLVRIVYMLGPDPEMSGGLETEESDQPLSLLRVVSRTLNLEQLMEGFEQGVASLIEAEQAAVESGETPETQTQVVIDHVVSLDFKFSDGEEWVESWEDEESPPQAVQVIVSVADEQDPTRKPAIQSTMSYFVMVPASQETAMGGGSGQPGSAGPGGSGGGPGGGGPGGGGPR